MADPSLLHDAFKAESVVDEAALEATLLQLADCASAIQDIVALESVTDLVRDDEIGDEISSVQALTNSHAAAVSAIDSEISSKRAELVRLNQRVSDLGERMKPVADSQGEEEHRYLFQEYVTKFENLQFLKYEIDRLKQPMGPYEED